MHVRALGYIGIDVSDLDAWRSYAETLGAMVVAVRPTGISCTCGSTSGHTG